MLTAKVKQKLDPPLRYEFKLIEVNIQFIDPSKQHIKLTEKVYKSMHFNKKTDSKIK
jgi:hypothetical protein